MLISARTWGGSVEWPCMWNMIFWCLAPVDIIIRLRSRINQGKVHPVPPLRLGNCEAPLRFIIRAEMYFQLYSGTLEARRVLTWWSRPFEVCASFSFINTHFFNSHKSAAIKRHLGGWQVTGRLAFPKEIIKCQLWGGGGFIIIMIIFYLTRQSIIQLLQYSRNPCGFHCSQFIGDHKQSQWPYRR